MKKCSPKKGADQSYATIPFPHPMATPEGQIVWPFARNAFPLFLAKIDCQQKRVEVFDSNAIKALQCFGFFGFFSKTKFVANDNPKDYHKFISKDSPESSKPRSDARFADGKYLLVGTIVPNALSSQEEQDSMSSSELQSSCQSITDAKVANVLQLSFLEAFFISYIFGSLNIFDPQTNEYMTIEQMWTVFCDNYSEDKLQFAAHYSAYHYLRSKGWIVRNGHSFGTNFLLYKEGPHLNHAQYSVLVRYSIDNSYDKSLDWYHMSALIRLSKNVRKELFICVVNIPKDCVTSSPKCIQNFEVELLSFDRWNPTKTDESQADD